MAPKPLPDQGFLRQCLNYDPETGELTWRARPREHFKSLREHNRWNKRFVGKRPGTDHGKGYRTVGFYGSYFFVHRVIWKWMTGNDPPNQIDHIDRNPTDNRWSNLRAATGHDNAHNKTKFKKYTNPFKGVQLRKKVTPRYMARITVEGVRICLGRFATAEEAHEAYCNAAKLHYGEFWSGG